MTIQLRSSHCWELVYLFYISPSICFCFALCYIHFLFVTGVNPWVIILGP